MVWFLAFEEKSIKLMEKKIELIFKDDKKMNLQNNK